MSRSRALFFLLLSIVVCAWGIKLFAQEIDLPEVTWKDPNGKEFHVNDKLVLHFQSNVGGDKLRARVFRGSKRELIETGQPDGKNAQGKYCVIYNSTVHTQSGGLHDEISFNWYMDMGSLKRRSDGGNDDQVYTVVLENTDDKIQTFRLDPDYVAKYFDRGLEITIKADGYQTAGLWSAVQTVEFGVKGSGRDEDGGVRSGSAYSRVCIAGRCCCGRANQGCGNRLHTRPHTRGIGLA
jgi:hypothetical protein